MSRLVILCLVASCGHALLFANGRTSAAQLPSIKNSTDCCFLSGLWYNNLGSVMRLLHSPDGSLTGRFLTAVESKKGAAGGVQLINGRIGQGKPTTFGMVVSYKNGRSTAAWSGLFHKCKGKETLLTTWVLTSRVNSCGDFWMSTRIGQDTFWRKTPQKSDDTLLGF